MKDFLLDTARTAAAMVCFAADMPESEIQLHSVTSMS